MLLVGHPFLHEVLRNRSSSEQLDVQGRDPGDSANHEVVSETAHLQTSRSLGAMFKGVIQAADCLVTSVNIESTPYFRLLASTLWPPAVESSIAVEDAVENRGLYHIFVLHLF